MDNSMTIEFERGKTVVVDRGAERTRAGQGMLVGMGVVLQHFRDAFTKKLDDPSKISGLYTTQYPEEREQLPEAARNFPILLYEDSSGQELCTSCFQCERICPPQVIHMTQAKDPTTGKPVPAVSEFVIEYDACMSCGLCAEVCPFDAIKMDHAFELSTAQHGGLTIDRVGLLRPISYYAKLAPSMWGEVADGALKKLQGAAKRRTGAIGLAPGFTGNAALEQLTPDASAMLASAPDLPDTIATSPLAPADPKAAKLAAIRAANAAKSADTSETPAPAVESAPATPADPKAAKLAAIRAANAAKKAQETPPE